MIRPGDLRREFAAPLNAFQGELNRLFDHYRHAWTPGSKEGEERTAAAWTPAVDLYETPDEWILLADLPGVDPSAVELSIDGSVLVIRGEKPAGTPEGATEPVSAERPSGPFLRQVPLTSEVNIDAIQADLRDGVLLVRMPKAEAAKPHSIPIRTA